MHVFLDVLLVAVLGFFLFLGWRRGFAGSVLKSGRLILTMVITLSCGSGFSSFIDRVWIHPPVYEKVHARFTEVHEIAHDILNACAVNNSLYYVFWNLWHRLNIRVYFAASLYYTKPQRFTILTQSGLLY